MDEVTGNFLDELRRMPTETEWLEFKRAEQSSNFDHMAQYVSALANEANLYRREEGWLVMGIENKIDPSSGLRPATGTRFAQAMEEVNRIKESIAAQTSPQVVLQAPCVLHVPDAQGALARVLLWRIPAAPGACRWPARAITGGAPGKNSERWRCTSLTRCARNRRCTIGRPR